MVCVFIIVTEIISDLWIALPILVSQLYYFSSSQIERSISFSLDQEEAEVALLLCKTAHLRHVHQLLTHPFAADSTSLEGLAA